MVSSDLDHYRDGVSGRFLVKRAGQCTHPPDHFNLFIYRFFALLAFFGLRLRFLPRCDLHVDHLRLVYSVHTRVMVKQIDSDWDNLTYFRCCWTHTIRS